MKAILYWHKDIIIKICRAERESAKLGTYMCLTFNKAHKCIGITKQPFFPPNDFELLDIQVEK